MACCALGSDPQTALAAALGVERGSNGCIVTDGHQRTSVPMVWAAGYVVTGLNQSAVAMAQAEVAAMECHSILRRRESLSLQAPLAEE